MGLEKQRMYRKNIDGTKDLIYRETSSDLVKHGNTDLNTKVNEIDSSLAEITQQVNEHINNHPSGGSSTVFINVKDFGAKGDGITNDSISIKSAILALPKTGGVLLFPSGVYLHGDGTNNMNYPVKEINGLANCPYGGENIGTDIRLLFDGYKNIKVSGYGAKIISHPSNGMIRYNAIFVFNNCENCVVEGFGLDGKIDTRYTPLTDYGGYNEQSNIMIVNCKRMKFIDINSSNATMDGFTIYNGKEIIIENCVANYCYRQGLSIVGLDKYLLNEEGQVNGVKVLNSEFSYTGQIYGTSPMFGIDSEGIGQHEVIISGCKFKENKGGVGLGIHWGASQHWVENCYFYNDGILGIGAMLPPYIVEDGERVIIDENVIKNCYFRDCDILMTQGGTIFEGNTYVITKTDKEYECKFSDTYSNEASGVTRHSVIRDNHFTQMFLSNEWYLGTEGEIQPRTMSITASNEAIVEYNTFTNYPNNYLTPFGKVFRFNYFRFPMEVEGMTRVGRVNLPTIDDTIHYENNYYDKKYLNIETGNSMQEIGEIVVSTNDLTCDVGLTCTFTVALDKKPTTNQNVKLNSSDNINIILDKNTLTFTPVDYNVPQTVTITCTANTLSNITLTSYKATTKTILFDNRVLENLVDSSSIELVENCTYDSVTSAYNILMPTGGVTSARGLLIFSANLSPSTQYKLSYEVVEHNFGTGENKFVLLDQPPTVNTNANYRSYCSDIVWLPFSFGVNEVTITTKPTLTNINRFLMSLPSSTPANGYIKVKNIKVMTV